MLSTPHKRKMKRTKLNVNGVSPNTASDSMAIRKKVAIIGSGSAAMGAAYALKNSDYEVHIFEKDSRLGGHTNTQIWAGERQTTPVDTGFIVMNTATYPNFINFLKDIDVQIKATEMSFGVSRNGGEFEWSGSAKGIFAQRRNLFRPRHWRLILDIVRFNQFALDLLNENDETSSEVTIGDYLDRHGYSQAFKDDYLIPMTAAVWSTSPDKASLEFPAKTLIRFMWNHHLLSTVARRPDWLTIPGGSQQYIDAIVKRYPSNRLAIHRSMKVIGLGRCSPKNEKQGTRLTLYYMPVGGNLVGNDSNGVRNDSFDQVIFACHGDQVLPILSGELVKQRNSKTRLLKNAANSHVASEIGASLEEHKIFSSFQTTSNICYLHSDLSLMPVRRDTWSSWNYLIDSRPSQQSHPAGVSLTYNMNILQHIPVEDFGDVLVTMNPGHSPAPHLIQGEFMYEHPLYTVEAIRAQEKLESIQNRGGVSFCGAWTKYGFHEDGFSSGLKVAIDHLGASVPFEFEDSTYSRGLNPKPLPLDYVLRIMLSAILSIVRLGELILNLPGIPLLVAVITFLPSLALDLLELFGFLA